MSELAKVPMVHEWIDIVDGDLRLRCYSWEETDRRMVEIISQGRIPHFELGPVKTNEVA